MREIEAVDVAFKRSFDAVEFGYVREVLLEDEACWGLFDSEGDVIFVGDDLDECRSFAAKEEIRIQLIQ
ncbi:hypothetical protein C9413_16440 [Rhizobium sp. SEMIA 4085]|uniref:Uncharacterized protein n=1 Tax=Rhizobium gallicum bv. gallicum R602sp TaxID=1041138 RepID=A0A0B4X8H0_9HYPH|nr:MULTISPECIES: hypothetical protein [Rhizobium]AJD43000.1 hypothetical protein RGR602_CH03700 [Rhizobium gallicum bv. gallicum R602sp]NNH31033.1 hypothetical protein [Rhizobium sp. SEMIA 4085]TDW16505.1 hypothetical protein EV128_13535 [Rhizobium azibense]